jgi:hypothetical protein
MGGSGVRTRSTPRTRDLRMSDIGTPDIVVFGASATCPCGNLTVGPVTVSPGGPQLSVDAKCAVCGQVVEVVPDVR